jgi:hypothetical protein
VTDLTPTPPGYCHCCGCHPSDTRDMWGVIHVIGQEEDRALCGNARGALPRDPADLVYLAVAHLLQDDLGYAAPGARGMDPALASRIRARVDASITTWTRRETRP